MSSSRGQCWDLQVALEESTSTHPCSRPSWSVNSAMDMLFPAGTFVRLEFKLRQTDKRPEEGLEETQVQSPVQGEEAEMPDLRPTWL